MDRRKIKVYVIYDHEQYNEADLSRELEDDRREFHFYFGNPSDNPLWKEFLESADEVWVFGVCRDSIQHKTACDLGKELWQMG